MGYADYDFYTTEYYGDLLTPEEFSCWNERASRWLDVETEGLYPHIRMMNIPISR